jgi:hypothetical protein
MAREKKEVINVFRNTSRSITALGMEGYVNNNFYYYIVAQKTGYTPGTVRKIIESYKKTPSWQIYCKFLKTIPCVYEEIQKSVSVEIIKASLSR